MKPIFLALILVLAFTGRSPIAFADAQSAVEAIRGETVVRDLLYQDDQAVKWQIGVLDDGSRRWGLASYFCEVLREHEVVDAGTSPGEQIVRIVDIVKVANGTGFRDASLGAVDCTSYEQLFP